MSSIIHVHTYICEAAMIVRARACERSVLQRSVRLSIGGGVYAIRGGGRGGAGGAIAPPIFH